MTIDAAVMPIFATDPNECRFCKFSSSLCNFSIFQADFVHFRVKNES